MRIQGSAITFITGRTMGKEELFFGLTRLRVAEKKAAMRLNWRQLKWLSLPQPSKSYHISSVNFTLPDVVISKNICEVVS